MASACCCHTRPGGGTSPPASPVEVWITHPILERARRLAGLAAMSPERRSERASCWVWSRLTGRDRGELAEGLRRAMERSGGRRWKAGGEVFRPRPAVPSEREAGAIILSLPPPRR